MELEAIMKELIRKKNVVYVRSATKIVGGVDTGRDAISVGVTKKVALSDLKKEDRVPPIVDGRETDVVVAKEIWALGVDAQHTSAAVDRKARLRPMPGGVSVGHPRVTAGTGTPILLPGWEFLAVFTNKHVGAPDEDSKVGDPLYQPGPYDGGGPDDVIRYLTHFVPIVFVGDGSDCPIINRIAHDANWFLEHTGHKSRFGTYVDVMNKVDAALAADPLSNENLSAEILGIGVPTGFNYQVEVKEELKKSGRTTEITKGIVQAIDALANVNYGNGKIAIFEDQIMTDAMSEGGDSGSIVVNKNNEIVGDVFAGSTEVTLINKISNVLEQLGVNG